MSKTWSPRRSSKKDQSATARQVRALIKRITADEGAPRAEGAEPRPAVDDDLEAKERRIEAAESALERQMQTVRRKRAGLALQRRERELRDSAAAAVAAEEARLKSQTERRVEEMRLELERRERACAARRKDLKGKIDTLCAEYEAAAAEAAETRRAFDEGRERVEEEARAALAHKRRHADQAVRRHLEHEALKLGFRITPRNAAVETTRGGPSSRGDC